MGELAKKSRELTSAAQFVDGIYLDFSKAFDTVSRGIVLEKQSAHGFDRCIVCCLESCLHVWEQTGGECVTPSLWPVSGGL